MPRIFNGGLMGFQRVFRNKCHASSNRCLTSSNKKLVETSATLVVVTTSIDSLARVSSCFARLKTHSTEGHGWRLLVCFGAVRRCSHHCSRRFVPFMLVCCWLRVSVAPTFPKRCGDLDHHRTFSSISRSHLYFRPALLCRRSDRARSRKR